MKLGTKFNRPRAAQIVRAGLVCLAVSLLSGSLALAQVSDDFSSFSLNSTLWTFVDPLGDSALSQSYGKVTLSVPAVTAHDIWTSGNQSARIVQPVADGGVSLEVKFESVPTSRFQIQGLLLEDSPGNYIRADFLHDGTSLKLFGASFIANSVTTRGNLTISTGNSELWLRVVRVGDAFTVTWSDDGAVWQPGFSFNHSFPPGSTWCSCSSITSGSFTV